MIRFSVISLLLLISAGASSQEYIPAPEEDSLYRMFLRFPHAGTVEEMQEMNSRIISYIEQVLADPESAGYRFDSLRRRAGILDADDGQFRIITWNLPLNAWEHEYHGVLQVIDTKRDTCSVYILKNKFNSIPDLVNAVTDETMWPGALYYDIRREKQGREQIYTLMGFNFHDRWSDKKIIDVLYFDEDLNPRFGKPVFSTPEGMQNRVVFEYSGEVAMSLRYNQDLKMIVYDHLAPIEPELKNFPRYYAPDFSYDGYKFRKGIWEHRANLDVRNR